MRRTVELHLPHRGGSGAQAAGRLERGRQAIHGVSAREPGRSAVALVAENKVLAHPASVDSLPTSGNREDHVSMGMTSAIKLQQVIQNVNTVIAIEALCAAQGLDFLLPLKPGHGSLEA